MPGSPFLSVIIPAYNEIHSIGATLQATRSYLDRQGYSYEIIVCADGTDGTREVVAAKARRDARLSVLGSPERGGKGKGIRQGVARAGGDIIGFIDADYKTPVEDLDRILPWFKDGYDVVIGSRARAESRIEVRAPLHRRLGSKVFAIGMHLLIGLWDIGDTQCGFKFFRGPVAHDLFSRQRIDGYMFDVEVLYLAQQSSYRIHEVGVRWRDDGDSRLELVTGNWRNFRDLLRIRLVSRLALRPQTGSTGKAPERQEVA
jgi:dolichyl-phosphate beta-glucosyltransferase